MSECCAQVQSQSCQTVRPPASSPPSPPLPQPFFLESLFCNLLWNSKETSGGEESGGRRFFFFFLVCGKANCTFWWLLSSRNKCVCRLFTLYSTPFSPNLASLLSLNPWADGVKLQRSISPNSITTGCHGNKACRCLRAPMPHWHWPIANEMSLRNPGKNHALSWFMIAVKT